MSRVRRLDQVDNTAEGRSHRKGAAFWLWRCVLGAALLMMGQPQLHLRAQTNSAYADANRCLLIVDTSRAMERRSQAMLDVVRNLVMSGLNGQLRRGDTLGLWTFNQELYAGRLPLQVWSTEDRENIATRTIAFLRAQQYSKRASFDSVLPALDRVVKNSERITVVLVSSGEEKIQGTPFDSQIRDFCQRGRSQQRKAHMPFVTILRAQNGRLTDYTLNMPPEPLRVPHLPQVAQEVVQSKPSESGPRGETKPAVLPGQTGQVARPPETPAAKPEPASVKREALAPPTTKVDTNKSAAIKTPEVSTVPANVQKAEPAPVVEKAPVSEPPPKPKPTSPPIVEHAATPAPAAPEGMASLAATSTNRESATAATPTPAPSAKPTLAPPPSSPATEVVVAGVLATATGAVSSPPLPNPVVSPSPTTTVAAVQTATATPPAPLTSRKSLWIAALVFAILTVGIVLLLLQRARSAPRASLITRSIDRRKKP